MKTFCCDYPSKIYIYIIGVEEGAWNLWVWIVTFIRTCFELVQQSLSTKDMHTKLEKIFIVPYQTEKTIITHINFHSIQNEKQLTIYFFPSVKFTSLSGYTFSCHHFAHTLEVDVATISLIGPTMLCCHLQLSQSK